jgi:hypothetical protein
MMAGCSLAGLRGKGLFGPNALDRTSVILRSESLSFCEYKLFLNPTVTVDWCSSGMKCVRPDKGVFKRKGSDVWQHRIYVPADETNATGCSR